MLRILFLTHAFNSLSQRLFIELREHGHEVSVEFDINDHVTTEAVQLYQPDLIIAPFLKRAIPETIWRQYVCLIVHPGIVGDRGPSSLDWAILNQEPVWGVTVLQANHEMDAGDIWASCEFAMRTGTKASLYRNEVTEAAVTAVLEAVQKFCSVWFKPQALDYSNLEVRGKLQPLIKQQDRKIDWYRDSSEDIVRKIRSADGFPGVLDNISGHEYYLYDAHLEQNLSGKPGALIARCGQAVCRATVDGAVWVGHLRDRQTEHSFKLPAAYLLTSIIKDLPEVGSADSGYRDIWYEQEDKVGYLYFPFYNGAMGTEQCQRLHKAYTEACQQNTRVIVLMGGDDFWSNGMHLNLIEQAESAAEESWRNINALNDLAEAIINTRTHLTVSVLQGNAGAGGVFLARAADKIWARKGVVLNPHYKDMGNLYGSEYWTYLLERYAGTENMAEIIQLRLPMGTTEALSMGLINQCIDATGDEFTAAVRQQALSMALASDYKSHLEVKNQCRDSDEHKKPLAQYREEELQKMHLNFFGFDPSYHIARYNFVHKIAKSRTPLTIALHRRINKELNNNNRRSA